MINLHLLCEDLKDRHSELRHKVDQTISKIFSFLNNPSPKTAELIAGWREDFRYIYGDISTNLSSNSKLDRQELLSRYNITGAIYFDEKRIVEAVQMLFFSIQTYFCLLEKYIMKNFLQNIRYENEFTHRDIILGEFAEEYRIHNYCYEDWYCWPVFELNNGFVNVMDEISLCLESYRELDLMFDLKHNNRYDYVKQIYEAIIPKELRHALGEYYTPDWLAEATLNNAIVAYEKHSVEEISIVDPTCGSGTFLFKAISYKRKNGCDLKNILATVFGIDINPLAVLTAKTNYLLAIIDLLDGETEIYLPVYNADIVRLVEEVQGSIKSDDRVTADVFGVTDFDEVGEAVEGVYDTVRFEEAEKPANVVRTRILLDRQKVQNIKDIDIVIGNPPWVNWEYLPEQYRVHSRHLWVDYGLFSAKGRDLSFSKEDISVLITYIVMDKLLKTGGMIAFVIRQGIFKSAQNGVGFRRFRIRDDVPVKVLKVEDLSQIRVFENAVTSTAIFYAQKGKENKYPVPYYLWEKRADSGKFSFGAYVQLEEVLSRVSVLEQWAMPADKKDITSLWITAAKSRLYNMKKLLGTNEYRARTGVFTGGANAVYWLQVNAVTASCVKVSTDDCVSVPTDDCVNVPTDDCITVTNIVERAKRKAERVTAEIESTYVYPMLRGSNVRKWGISYDTYLLCPHTRETKMWPVSQKDMQLTSPKTLDYLYHFKGELDSRNGFAGWEKEIQQQEFHAVLRVGEYTFARYKVVWKYIAQEFVCAVISTVRDKYLGEKLLLPNEKIMYVGTDNEMEAYYLCGILSSTQVAECVKSYMNPTSISAHVLNKLNIPRYDAANELHVEIARICREGHDCVRHEEMEQSGIGHDKRKSDNTDITQYIRKMDELVSVLYKL